MNLTSKLYQPAVVERIAATDWSAGNSGPLVVELDPTAACDLACPGCISEDLITLGGRFSDQRLLELGNEFIESGVNAVILIGGGEPLAHPKIGDFINLLGENNVHVGITTNGTFIHRYLDAIARYSQWTRISMDAATQELFDILRPAKQKKSKFQRVIDNIEMLAKVKQGKLGYSYLIQTEADGAGIVSNVHEIYDAAVLARELGCDYFEVKPTYQFREDVPHALMKHDEAPMARAREEIERLGELETDSFKVLKAINLEYSLSGLDTPQLKDYKHCPSTHLRTTITPSGAYVCPYWRGKQPMKIGDVNETSFSDMWNSEQRREAMQQLDAARDCNFHCLRHNTNLASLEIKDALANGGVETVEEFDRFI